MGTARRSPASPRGSRGSPAPGRAPSRRRRCRRTGRAAVRLHAESYYLWLSLTTSRLQEPPATEVVHICPLVESTPRQEDENPYDTRANQQNNKGRGARRKQKSQRSSNKLKIVDLDKKLGGGTPRHAETSNQGYDADAIASSIERVVTMMKRMTPQECQHVERAACKIMFGR